MTKSTEEQIAAIERRMEQLRARKQRIVARENARARRRRTHLLIQLGGILASDSVLGYDERVWGDEGNRRRLLAALGAHAGEVRVWARDACFASMFVRQVRQCFSAVWADGFPRCRHRFPVM